MQNRKPMVLVFAGPNGSGKSQEHWVKQRRRCYRKMQSITDNSDAFVIVKNNLYIFNVPTLPDHHKIPDMRCSHIQLR